LSIFDKHLIRVLVIDDSTLMREAISDLLTQSGKIDIVGKARNGKEGLEMARLLKPEIITCDVEMPVMDGISYLKELRRFSQVPVLMISSVTYEGGVKTMQALDAGAFDFVQKPNAQYSRSMNQVAGEIIDKVKLAYENRTRLIRSNAVSESKIVKPGTALSRSFIDKRKRITARHDYVVGIGISTGGPPCITRFCKALKSDCPPVLIVQHMPAGFTKAMADRINKDCVVNVKEAEPGDVLQAGHVFIAPGHSHVLLHRETSRTVLKLSQDPLMSGHRPSADMLFQSMVEWNAAASIALLMTGMGRDGATWMKKIKEGGGLTVAQDESSCTVFGMPKAAISENAHDHIMTLDEIIQFGSELSRPTNVTLLGVMGAL
jgi:two-component system chemotaxis response regulator CheB